jgi:glycosyltransferase involved in cell wall biosynthesis
MDQTITDSSRPSGSSAVALGRRLRLAYFVSHPIQYQAPLLRLISCESDIDLTVFFSSDFSVRAYRDPGFGIEVEWDVPLLSGYKYEFLPHFLESNRLGFFNPLNYGVSRRLARGRFDAAWIFGYSQVVSVNAILSAKMLGIPIILRAESNLDSHVRSKMTLGVKRALARLLKPAVDYVLPIGKANERYWKYYLGEEFPMACMPYAVDNDFFRTRILEAASQRDQLRCDLGLAAGRPIILFASKLQTRKRCIDLVEAYIRLAPAPAQDPDAYLLIVGDGEERGALEARVRNSGLSSIRFLGFRNQTELPRFYDLCDVFVLPSHGETWGLVVNEVMNAGRPVIVSDQVGCQADLVVDGENGLVYRAFDVEALSCHLRTVIGNPEFAAQMGQAGLRRIQHYSFKENVTALRRALAYTVPGFAA